ncbi:MAG: hypothetical protein H6511_09225 [Holophagales bacterium]|nr:hypothetical protein [Holophagales bacterium]
MWRAHRASLAALLFLVVAPLQAAELAGVVRLLEKGRPVAGGDQDLDRAVVWFVPDGKAAPPKPQRERMVTVRKQFSPQVLVVPVGSTVEFPNQDPILHNVFSVSNENAFDLGLVGAGEGKAATFGAPGIVQVFCNVHHKMFAHVVVVESAHFALADAAGSFRLTGLPEGRGTLHYWHERGEPGSVALVLPRREPATIAIEITKPKLPPHRNKFGKSYSRSSYG